MVTDNFVEIVRQKKMAHDNSTLLSQYEIPLVTVDVVIFTVQENRLKALLIRRRNEPFEHSWALPGGFIRAGESLLDSAAHRLQEETNVGHVHLEQLQTFGKPDRDPRTRVITVAFYALVSAERLHLEAHANAEDVDWFCVTELPELAFDHSQIMTVALKTLKKQLEATPIAFQLLPKKFTLTELQRVYELVQEKSLDKRNFRKKILSSGTLDDTGETKREGYHRPAQLYSFVDVLPPENV